MILAFLFYIFKNRKFFITTYWNNKIFWIHLYYFFNSNIQFMFNLHKSGMPYINGNSFICVRLIISS